MAHFELLGAPKGRRETADIVERRGPKGKRSAVRNTSSGEPGARAVVPRVHERDVTTL